ncbi:uncharacterized protein LOC143290719 [Babylonia areolata]|uniref:uncharacterized protein LOC143290719 n=1 Tax=Babylonia areolata TaxID=304850 RepID=UPI003FD6B15E
MDVTSSQRQWSPLNDTYPVNTSLAVNDVTIGTNYSATSSSPLFIPCDNPRNVISPFVAEMVELVMYVGVLPAFVICGVTTNVINMAVFVRQGLSDRIHVCLFSLALSDTGCLLFVMSSKCYTLIGLFDPVAGNYWQQRHNSLVLGLYWSFLGLSNTITTIIAVERCLCVLSPLKAAKYFRTKYMVALIVGIAVYILAVKNTGLNIKYQTVEVTDHLTNTSTFISRLSPFYLRHRTIIDIIYLYLLSVTLPFLSLVVVIVCTAAIILRLKITADWRRKSVSNMTSVEKQEVTMTRMLVTVCCVYVVCITPSMTRVLLFSRVPGFLSTGYLCNIYRVSTSFTLMLEALNASVNFVIYVKQSSQYRSTLSQMVHWGKHGVKK